MSDLLFSLNTVFPLLVIMGLGFLSRRAGIVSPDGVRQGNRALFHVFLPLMLCLNIMDAESAGAPVAGAMAFSMCSTTAIFLSAFLIVPKFCKNRPACGVMIQAIGRSNYAIFGLPLVRMMYPGAQLGVASMLVLATVPLYGVFSVIALSVYSGGRANLKSILKTVAVNPLIISTLLGAILWKLGVSLPKLIDTPVRSLGSIASPLALFLLGASLDFSKLAPDRALITIGVIARLIIVPAIFLPISVMLGFRGINLAALIAAFAAPTAVTSYTMTCEMGGDEPLASALVVFSTAFSVITVFLIVLCAKSLALI